MAKENIQWDIFLNMTNFTLVNCDTDSISICKADMSYISEEERAKIIHNVNSLYKGMIEFANDGYFDRFITVKAKNYFSLDKSQKDPKKQLKIRGASLKATTKEIYLQEFIKGVINILLDPNHNQNQIIDLYNQTAKECLNLKNMSRHSKKITLTEAVLKSNRTNELRVRLAIKGEQGVQQGDRFRMFYLPNGNLCLDKNFSGEYCKISLLEKLYSTVKVFNTIIPKELFKNYSLQVNYYPFIGEEKPKRTKKLTNG